MIVVVCKEHRSLFLQRYLDSWHRKVRETRGLQPPLQPERITVVGKTREVMGEDGEVLRSWSGTSIEYLSLAEYRDLVGAKQLKLEMECLSDRAFHQLRSVLG
jgi:hypothetical protein